MKLDSSEGRPTRYPFGLASSNGLVTHYRAMGPFQLFRWHFDKRVKELIPSVELLASHHNWNRHLLPGLEEKITEVAKMTPMEKLQAEAKTNRHSQLAKTTLANLQRTGEYLRTITVNLLMRVFFIFCACRIYLVKSSTTHKPIPIIPNFPSKVPPPIPEFQMEAYLFECEFQGNPVRVGLDFRFFPYPTDLRILGCGWGTFFEIPFSGIRCEMVVEEKRPGKWKSLYHEWGAAFIAFLSDSLRVYFKSNQNPCPLTLFAAFLNFEDLKKELPFIIVRSFRQVHPRRQHEENKDSISTDRFNGAVVIRKDSNPLILSPTINVSIDSKWEVRFGLEAFLPEMKEEPFGLVEGDFLPSVLYWLPGEEHWKEIDDLKIHDRGAFGIGEVSQAPSEWFDLQGNVFAYKGWAAREIKDAGIFLGTMNPLEQMKEIADTFFIWRYPEDGEYPPYCDVLSFERSVESLFEKK
jgi:hypothetical protein